MATRHRRSNHDPDSVSGWRFAVGGISAIVAIIGFDALSEHERPGRMGAEWLAKILPFGLAEDPEKLWPLTIAAVVLTAVSFTGFKPGRPWPAPERVIVVHVRSVLLSIAAGAIIAALYAAFPPLRMTWLLLPAGVLGYALGRVGVGAAALLATSAMLPIVALAGWTWLAGSPDSLAPGWYYRLALIAAVLGACIAISAVDGDEAAPR